MRLSRPAAYALRALACLAERRGEGLVECRWAARGCGVPRAVLCKALKRLVAVGLLHSRRGKGGGYRLARPLSEITVLEVIEAVEGPVGVYNPLAREGADRLDRRVDAVCRRSGEAARRELARVRLSDLAGGR
jgi:Rrf2 family protein